MAEINKFQTKEKITWCPGCGNFSLFVALRQAFIEIGLEPDDILIVYGIGCHGHMVNYMKTFGFESLHGRALPLAQGVKIANKNLTVITIVGDGDQLGEGGNHLIHASKRNLDLTCIIHNNQLYSLTVGQTSPTSEKGIKTRSTPFGNINEPLNSLSLSIAAGASFVARGFAGEIKHLTKIFVEAIKHRGFSLVDVLQPCPTLNYLNTYQYFYQRVYKLEETNFNFQDKISAFQKSLEWGEKIPIGIFYKKEGTTFEQNHPLLKEKPMIEYPIKNIDIEKLLKEFS